MSGIAAGLQVIAALPERYGPQDRFLERAAAAGVAVRPLTDFAHAPVRGGGVRLVVGYAQLSPARIREGIRLMADALVA